MKINKRFFAFMLILFCLVIVYVYYSSNEIVIRRGMRDVCTLNNRRTINKIEAILNREFEPVELEYTIMGFPVYSIDLTVNNVPYTYGVSPNLIHITNHNEEHQIVFGENHGKKVVKGDLEFITIDIRPQNFYKFDRKLFEQLEELIEPLFSKRLR